MYITIFILASCSLQPCAMSFRIISVVSFSLLGVFVFSEIFFMNLHYINNHSFMALVLLAIAFLLFSPFRIEWMQALFISFLVLLSSMTRMEGFLYSFMLIVMGVFSRKDREEGLLVLSLSLLLSIPYIIFLTYTFWQSGFILGWQYLFMLSGGVLALLIYTTSLKGYFIAPRIHIIVLIGLSFLFLIFTAIKPNHMLPSFVAFIYNMGNPSIWGFSIITSIILTIIIITIRYNGKQYWIHTDALLVWFLSAVLLTLIITMFRSPLRMGMFDSANRMLFHFVPILIVWVGVEIARALRPIHYARS